MHKNPVIVLKGHDIADNAFSFLDVTVEVLPIVTLQHHTNQVLVGSQGEVHVVNFQKLLFAVGHKSHKWTLATESILSFYCGDMYIGDRSLATSFGISSV